MAYVKTMTTRMLADIGRQSIPLQLDEIINYSAVRNIPRRKEKTG